MKGNVVAEFKQIFERFDFQVKKMQQSITEGRLTTVDEDEAVMKEEDPDVKDMFSAKHSGMSKHTNEK